MRTFRNATPESTSATILILDSVSMCVQTYRDLRCVTVYTEQSDEPHNVYISLRYADLHKS